MEKIKKVLFALVLLAVMLVMALRGCPRHTHFRGKGSHRHTPAVTVLSANFFLNFTDRGMHPSP
jgi:hypothetical protein